MQITLGLTKSQIKGAMQTIALITIVKYAAATAILVYMMYAGYKN